MADVYLNILQDTKDPHYRYKMPKLTTKIEGSGNGIKTVLTNMTAVAKALGRPPSYPTKYFGIELGALVAFGNDFTVNGQHDSDKLQTLLYGFIRKFVLCAKCKNPETHLTIDKNIIKQKCIACGHGNVIDKSVHRLTAFILNHPPDGSNPKASSSEKKDKKSKKSDKKDKDSPSSSSKHSKESSAAPSTADFNNKAVDDFDDDFDDEELTASAYTERLKELTDGFNSDMYLSDKKGAANLFLELVKQKKEAGQLMETQTQIDLLKESERLNLKDKAILILSECLFTENILEEIKTYRLLLLRFCKNQKAQKYLLGAFEKLVGEVYLDKLFNNSMIILKAFYDVDILEEAAILEWGAKESKKYVGKDMSKKIHEKCAKFITWLKEAEEESDEDDDEEDEENGQDDEEDEEEIGNKKHAANNGKTTTNGTSSAQKQKSVDEDEDDDDDDMIDFSHRVSGIEIKTVSTNVTPLGGGKPVNADVVEAAAGGEEDPEDLDIDNI
jgi:translation initiation factor 5